LPAAINLLGRRATFDIDVRGAPPGLRSATVRLQTADTAVDLAREEYPVAGWFSRSLTHTRLHVAADLAQLHVPEGAATLEVFVTAYGGDGGPSLALSAPVTVDLTAPQIELLTTRHRVRLGGADVAVFRQSPDTAESGIAVEQYFFPAATGYFADPTIAVAFFAIPERLSTNAEPHLTARDAAGNRSDLTLRCRIEPRTFEERTLALDEDYLGRKVPEIEHAARLRARGDLLERYLRLNRDLRQRNEERIRELTTASEPQPLWDGRFHIPPHTAMTASFANRRAYTYRGAVVDRQTHLGIDLAAPEGSPIEAVQRGVVVYAGDLGIYGGTVVLDHGLGIFSLYGHLGAIAVRPGEPVMAGQYLGQMGQTGLASGPHLHFSIMVHGVHVDPTEWLNPAWLGRYINPKLALLPLAATRTAAQPADRTR
jgi:murein DD-endopeptidase MepM/ murein hydrolase activator NlpD